MEENKYFLIDRIKSAPLSCLTNKQLKSLYKIIEEYLATNRVDLKNNDSILRSKIEKLRDEYKEWVEDTGFVDIGIEYEWLKKMDNVLKD